MSRIGSYACIGCNAQDVDSHILNCLRVAGKSKDVTLASLTCMAWLLKNSPEFDFSQLQLYLEANNVDITLEPDDHDQNGLLKYRPGKVDTKYVCVYHVGQLSEYRQKHIERIMEKFSREEYLRALSVCGIWVINKPSSHSTWREMIVDESIVGISTGKIGLVDTWTIYDSDVAGKDYENVLIAMYFDGAPILAARDKQTGKIISQFGYVLYPDGKQKIVDLTSL